MKKDNIIATQGLTSLFDGQPDIDSTEKKVELIKTKLREFFNLKNVNFLFPDFVIAYPKILRQRVLLFSDVLPSALFGYKPPCSKVA